MFVAYTPGSTLVKILRDIEKRGADEQDWCIKIVERSGQELLSQLVKAPLHDRVAVRTVSSAAVQRIDVGEGVEQGLL